MDINFKFLPAFLGALALTATLGASKPAPRQAQAPPAATRPAPATAPEAPRTTAAGVRAEGSAVLLVATHQAGTPQRPAADQDDW